MPKVGLVIVCLGVLLAPNLASGGIVSSPVRPGDLVIDAKSKCSLTHYCCLLKNKRTGKGVIWIDHQACEYAKSLKEDPQDWRCKCDD